MTNSIKNYPPSCCTFIKRSCTPSQSCNPTSQRRRFLKFCAAVHIVKIGKADFYHLKAALLLLVLFLPLSLGADTIFLKDGTSVEGKFQGVVEGYYQILLKNGKVKYVPEADIKDIQTGSGSRPKSLKKKSWFPSLTYHVLTALGWGEVQYINDGLAETQSLSELGLGNISGEAAVEYPNSHAGPLLRAAVAIETSMGPGAGLELGLDLSILPLSKTDSPLKIETSFTTLQGIAGDAKVATEQTYTYSYLTAMAGISSYFQTVNLYLSYYLRFAVFGSYSVKEESSTELSVPALGVEQTVEDEADARGSISGRPLGLGVALTKKELFYFGKRPISLSLLCSIDSLSLRGEDADSKERKETLLFYGVGLSTEF